MCGVGGLEGYSRSRSVKLHPFHSYFPPPSPLPPPPPHPLSLSHPPPLCVPSLSSLALPNPLTSPAMLSLFLSLPPSLHSFAGASLAPADNACNWSDSHFSSVFGPDKEYCQRFFADTASAGRIKWTLFSSVCRKLKASQFICSRPRLTGRRGEGGGMEGVSYSHA